MELFDKLDNLINSYDNIIISGHIYPDLDCFGAGLALVCRIVNMGKKAYLFLDKDIHEYSDVMVKSLDKVTGIDYINSKGIENLDKVLVIIVDLHQRNRLECPSLLKMFDYVILDHHIKDSKCPKDAKLTYINSNLSSMIELVTYYLDYTNTTVNGIIATIMLAGLEIDTNNYNLKTTSRTYQAASMLVSMGADITLKQELLKMSKDDYVKQADYIKNSYTINDSVAICVFPDISKPEVLAKVATELLTFENIEASFAIAKLSGDEYGVSARSYEKIDVLKIIKKLNGGGSKTNAATKTHKKLSEIKSIIINSFK